MYKNGICSDTHAYILGFIYADGHVDEKYHRLSFRLSNKDKDFLIKLCEVFNNKLNKSYIVRDYNNISYLGISSKNFCIQLKNFGINNRKTYDDDSKIFDLIPDIYKHAFIRGYFDGDGCISYSGKYVKCCITSMNNKLLNSIKVYLKIYGIKAAIYKRSNHNYYDLYINSNDYCIKFKNLIYNNMELCLLRKYTLFTSITPIKRLNKYKNIHKHGNYYDINLTINGVRKYCGSFKTELEALNHYNMIANLYGYDTQEIIINGAD